MTGCASFRHRSVTHTEDPVHRDVGTDSQLSEGGIDAGLALAPSDAHPEQSLSEILTRMAITTANFAQPLLYSWTTPSQLEELRQTNTLLVATALTHGPATPFNQLLSRIAFQSNESTETKQIAQMLLRRPFLNRRRYAWTWPLATSLGFTSRPYGSVLIRITMRNDTVVGWLAPSHHAGFMFVTMDNQPISQQEVMAHPERLAVIFHVRTERSLAYAFREYIVCNEQMVQQWEVGTPAVIEELQREVQILQQLQSYVAEHRDLSYPRQTPRQPLTPQAWTQLSEQPAIAELYSATLAADVPRYELQTTALSSMIDVMREAINRNDSPLFHRAE